MAVGGESSVGEGGICVGKERGLAVGIDPVDCSDVTVTGTITVTTAGLGLQAVMRNEREESARMLRMKCLCWTIFSPQVEKVPPAIARVIDSCHKQNTTK